MNSIYRPLLRLAALCALVVPTTGCFVLEREYPEKTLHLLSYRQGSESAEPKSDAPDVTVTAFRISPGFDTRELVVRRGETEYELDFYHEYFVPPADAIRAAARAAIAESTSFGGGNRRPDYLLEGNIRRLGGDLRNESSPKAFVDLQLLIVRSSNGDTLHERSIVLEEPIDDASSEQIFDGLCRVTTRALREFVAEAAAKLPNGEGGAASK